LPGGFVNEDEPPEAAARRELREETGVTAVSLDEVGTFGDPGRDPRGWTVSIAYCTYLDDKNIEPKAADDAAEVAWFPLAKLPRMAFDHVKILAAVRRRVRGKQLR
jgi:8-oxo-dGTP diphosphatase